MNLLLHMCCGPCACFPVKKLRSEGIEPVGYFFNPNIHPYMEWTHRQKTAKEYAEKVGLKIYTQEDYRLKDFLEMVMPVEEPDNPFLPRNRCRSCYGWRLDEAAIFAAENGFDAFSSTLFYSIHQQHAVMKEIAEACGRKHGIDFYYEDFRVGWQEGIDISLELGLYRQPYCGCIFSEEERFSKEIRKQRKKISRAMRAERERMTGIE